MENGRENIWYEYADKLNPPIALLFIPYLFINQYVVTGISPDEILCNKTLLPFFRSVFHGTVSFDFIFIFFTRIIININDSNPADK
ncbi:hypothetical protein [Xenorhabdus sp. SGI246]|uniref:hypothetical protein n=1 Tax=Xenorhabdus sp. SGI246 TaxID=3158263 RepID=UPI00349F8D44